MFQLYKETLGPAAPAVDCETPQLCLGPPGAGSRRRQMESGESMGNQQQTCVDMAGTFIHSVDLC